LYLEGEEKMFRKKAWSLLLLTIGLILAGCYGGESGGTGTSETGDGEEDGALDEEQYYNVILDADPATLDATTSSDQYGSTVLMNVLEPLTRLAEKGDDVEVVPAGAEKWEHNEDETIWTFHIRENKWSDGEPVRAQVYE